MRFRVSFVARARADSIGTVRLLHISVQSNTLPLMCNKALRCDPGSGGSANDRTDLGPVNWRRFESELNHFPNDLTQIGGLDIQRILDS